MTEPPVVALIDPEAARFAKALADLPVILRPYVAPTPPAERALATIAYALAAPDRLAAYLPAMPALRWAQSTWAGVNPLLPLLPSRPELLVSALKGPFGALMVRYLNFWLDGFEQGLLVALAAQRRARWTHGAVRRQSARNFRGARAVVLGTGAIGADLGAALSARGYHAIGLNRSGTRVPSFAEVYPIGRAPRGAGGGRGGGFRGARYGGNGGGAVGRASAGRAGPRGPADERGAGERGEGGGSTGSAGERPSWGGGARRL